MIIVFSYNRLEMLKQVVSELQNEDFIILDDGSEFDIESLDCNYIRFEHGGKAGFWQIWNEALELCKESDDDFFLFLQDDITAVDLKKIKQIHKKRKSEPYVYSILNDGTISRFVGAVPVQINKNEILTGWVDCLFFCNRSALEALNFEMNPIPTARHKQEGLSSGVGQQLTIRLHRANVPMYKPVKSLAYHGDHESVMHKEERKRNPLISK